MFGSGFLFFWLDLLSEIDGVRFGRLEVSFSDQVLVVPNTLLAYEHAEEEEGSCFISRALDPSFSRHCKPARKVI